MDSFLNRRKNITVLLLVILGQLILVAVQVKNEKDIPVIRSWTVTAVTPLARLIEGVRSGGVGFFRNYIMLRQTDAENRRLQAEVDRLRLDNIFLKNELNTADRAKALQAFQSQAQSKTLAATVIGVGAGANSKTLFVDRGSASGVKRGMGAVTPEGIVGKVVAVYPAASQVMLISDPQFAAGVVSQKNQAHGVVKGQGTPLCKVDYVALGDKVEVGEWLYTSGDDRIFPRGFPVGIVKSVRDAQPYKEIYMEPVGARRGLEDLLIIIDGVHQALPEQPPSEQPAPPPPAEGVPQGGTPPAASGGTKADEVRSQYQASGDAQGHVFGSGLPGSKPPDFTRLGQQQGAATAPAPAAGRGAPAAAPKPVSAGRGPSPPVSPPPGGRAGGPPQR